jgi:hypothetical protein
MDLPRYEGSPLSMLARIGVTNLDPTITLWHWGPKLETQPATIETIDRLTSQGYEQVARQPGEYHMAALLTQCCDVAYLEDGSKFQLWARSEDIAHVTRYPVVLAFQLEENPPQFAQAKTIDLLQFLPLPRTGDWGIIPPDNDTSQDLTVYRCQLLPKSVQQLKVKFGEALQRLAGDSKWANHNDLHPFCTSELDYLRTVTNLRSLLIESRGKKHEQAKKNLADLERSHHDVTTLRQSWLQPDWLVQWGEIRRMAKDLAAEYFEHHQKLTHTDNKPVPQIANAFHKGVAEIFTHQPFQAYSSAVIARPDEWQQETAEKENELILSYRRVKPSGTTFVQIREELRGDQSRETALARMWEQTNKLSDLDADVYLAMIAQMLKGVKDEQGNTWITAQQILDYRGIEPKANKSATGSIYVGGHRWEDIEAIAACVKNMENVVIRVNEQQIIDDTAPTSNKRKRPRKTVSLNSRLFMFGDTIDHKTLPFDGPGRSITIAWQYRQSSWMVPFLEGSNRFTGLLFQKVLQYDPYHEVWEKRLSRHFMFWLRTNASHEKKPALVIGDLLAELNLGIEEDRPQRTRDRFEKAMDRLASDGLLTWDYKEKIELPPRKWLSTWLQQQITVEDPPLLKSHYMPIKAVAKTIRAEDRAPRQRKKRAKGKGEK